MSKLRGLEEWNRAINKQIQKVERETRNTIKKRGQLTERDAKKLVAVDSGELRRSINCEIQDAGFSAEISAQAINPINNFDYAIANEKGTRKMAAQPFLLPAFDNQVEKLQSDLNKIAKKIGD